MNPDIQYRVKFHDGFDPSWSDWEDYDPHEGIEIDAPTSMAATVQARVKPTEHYNLNQDFHELKTAFNNLKSLFLKGL